MQGAKEKICPFFKHNLCLLGDDCRLSHKWEAVNGGDDSDSDSSDEEACRAELANVDKSSPQDQFTGEFRPPPTPSPSAQEIDDLKKEIERAIRMTMVPRPLTNTPHEAGDNPGVAPLREPKVAQPNHDDSVFRPRWTSVRDEFERCGVLPPPPPEPFLGDLNVNNAEISSNRVTSRPIPINNSAKVTRAKEDSLSASPFLRDNHNHNAHGTSSVAPVNGYCPANLNLAMHAQCPPPETSHPGINVNN